VRRREKDQGTKENEKNENLINKSCKKKKCHRISAPHQTASRRETEAASSCSVIERRESGVPGIAGLA
jgi:hypothetical protein